ncbi:MAG: SDR family NAD(P)-dependent oxidoreductase [Myxococcota bacterium]|nr:SDR family NAD(P)-dependent oxidoreductase [Myxococcota bacterium]
MPEADERVAVVTGAGSGIGRALAERFAREGLSLVLADIETGALEATGARLEENGARVLCATTDVSDAAAVEALAEKCFAHYGRADVVCNNAGVLSGGLTWETSDRDWEWVLGVNVRGVANGIRSFVPRMSEQGSGHVVNVASMAALTSTPFAGVYHASKHAVLALSECLHKELRMTGSPLRVSVLCPEMVDTRIAESSRNRPESLAGVVPDSQRVVLDATARAARQGLDPAVMAERVMAALADGRFYVLAPDGPWRRLMETRLEDLRTGRDPVLDLPEQPPSDRD